MTYFDRLADGILDGTIEIESIEPGKELIKIGMSFARESIMDIEKANEDLHRAIIDAD